MSTQSLAIPRIRLDPVGIGPLSIVNIERVMHADNIACSIALEAAYVLHTTTM